MLVAMRKLFVEKGQGLTEYVLILAFVAGLAYMMFTSSGLKTTVKDTFSKSQSMISNAAQSSLSTQ